MFSSGIPTHLSPTSLPPPIQSRRRSGTTFGQASLPLPGYTPRSAPRAPLQGSRSDWRSKLRRPHPFIENGSSNVSLSRSNGRIVRTERNRNTGSIFGSGMRWTNVVGIKGILLMTTLVLSFIILILGLVYLGHTMSRIEDGLRQVIIPGTSEEGAQVYTINELVERDVSYQLSTRKDFSGHKLVIRDLKPVIQPRLFHHDDNNDNNNSNNSSDTLISRTSTKSSASASLFFYVATVPFLSMTHASILLLLLYLLSASARKARELSEKINDSSDSDSDNIDSEIQQNTKIEALRPYVPLISVLSTGLIATAWVTINAVQTQCELTTTTSDVCPILVPWGKTAGIHSMASARIVLSWITVVLYLLFMLVISKDSRLLTRPQSPTIIQISRPQPLPDSNEDIVIPRPRRSSMKSRSNSRDPTTPAKTVRFSLEDEESEKQRAERESQVPPVPSIPQEAMRRSMDVGLRSMENLEPPPEYTPSSTILTSTAVSTTNTVPGETADPDHYDSGSEYSSTTDSPCFGENRKRLTVNQASLNFSTLPEVVSPTPSVINSYGLALVDGNSRDKKNRTSIGTMAIKDKRRSSSL